MNLNLLEPQITGEFIIYDQLQTVPGTKRELSKASNEAASREEMV